MRQSALNISLLVSLIGPVIINKGLWSGGCDRWCVPTVTAKAGNYRVLYGSSAFLPDIFAQLANRITFNIHLKEHGEEGHLIKELVKLVDKYAAHDSVYFAASPAQLEWMQKLAPEIPRCAIQLPGDKIGIVDMARKYGCSRVQFWLDMFDADTIRTLHSENIACNLYFADTYEDYDKYFNMGIDTLLTNRMDLAAEWRRKQGK